jgi:hypothetical protein
VLFFFMRAGVAQSLYCLTKDWTIGIQSPAEVKDFFCSLCAQTISEAHPASYPVGTGDKARPGCDSDHSFLSSAEVKNEYELSVSSGLAPAWRSGTDLLFCSFSSYHKMRYHTWVFIMHLK